MQQQMLKKPEKSLLERFIDNLFEGYKGGKTNTKTKSGTNVEEVNVPILKEFKYVISLIVPRVDDLRARRYARFAAHSYGDVSNDILPSGCRIIEKHSTNNGLKATLYEDSDEIICSFAGTETLKDWENNIQQLSGSSPQYEDALKYGRQIRKKFPYKAIVFVGHSQGGGEAAYCAYDLGVKAETFNPAGLSILTICKGNYNSNTSINAYVFATDILNKFQWAFGTPADGDVHYISDCNVFEHGWHGMKGILKYFGII